MRFEVRMKELWPREVRMQKQNNRLLNYVELHAHAHQIAHEQNVATQLRGNSMLLRRCWALISYFLIFGPFEPKFDGGLLNEHSRALEIRFLGENKSLWM